MNLGKVNTYYFENKKLKALKLLDKIWISGNLEYLNMKMKILNSMERYEESIQIYNDVKIKFNEKNSDLIDIYHIYALYGLNRINEAKDSLKHFELRIDDKRLSNELLFYLNKFKTLLYLAKGDLQKALYFGELSKELLDFLDDEMRNYEMGIIYQKLGIAYDYLGNLHKATNSYKKSIFHNKNMTGESSNLMKDYFNLGNIFRTRGLIEEAYKHHCIAKEYAVKLNDITWIGQAEIEFGVYFIVKGDIPLALNHFNKAEEILKNSTNPFDLFYIYSSYFELYADLNDRENAIKYYEIIKRNPVSKDRAQIQILMKIYEGILYKLSPKIRDRAKAMDIFEKIAKSDVVDHIITFQALNLYLDMLIEDLIESQDVSIYMEIKGLIKRIEEFAIEQQVSNLLAKALLYKSKISLIDGDFNKSKEFIIRAKNLAEEYGYELLYMQISIEYDKLLHLSNSEVFMENKDFRTKIIESRLNKLVSEEIIYRPRINNVDDLKPISLYLYRLKGEKIYEFDFVVSKDKSIELLRNTTKMIISSINSQEDVIEGLENKIGKIIFKIFDNYVMSLVYTGSSPIERKIKEVLEILELSINKTKDHDLQNEIMNLFL